MKKRKQQLARLILALCIMLVGCMSSENAEKLSDDLDSGSHEKIIVGFSQVGAESDWRSENTASMKSALSDENGFELLFEDGQQKQSNQITAIRTFIQRGVDYIVLAPVTETGWDTVLNEAKEAGIPVIVVDRMIDVEDESLFTCWVGSDFELEGRKAVEWLQQYLVLNEVTPDAVHVVNIQGTLGASSQIGRTKALSEAAVTYGWDLLAEVPGDFTQAKAKEVMKTLLEQHDTINVVYCENDNEAFGAIEAIEEAGKTVGSAMWKDEIMVLSFDGVNDVALRYVSDDKITCIAECNPLHGPRVRNIIDMLEAGETPEKFSYVEGEVFSSYSAISQIVVDNKTYSITLLVDDKYK